MSELKVHIELTRFVQPEKIEIDANERAVNEKSQYCFFVCTTFDSFLNDFSTPYIYSKPVLIVAADNTDINSFEDINGKKAAEGLTSNFSDIARSYGAEIVGQDKFALAMECVLSGEADCAINDELTYAYWKQQKGGEDSTKIVAESDNVNSSAIMVKKGNDELIEKLNSAIDELLADGTVKEISEKYFGMDVSQP